MEIIEILKAILFGIVEGITEWMNPRTPFPRKARYSASGN